MDTDRPRDPARGLRATSLLDQWRGSVQIRPRLGLAVKAAVAASLAWLATLPLDAGSEAYRYYAPFGAVTAVSTSLAQSVRGATQVVAAIVVAVLITAGAELLALPTVVSVAAVVAVGTVVGSHRLLGGMGSWVPTSALLVLIVAGDEPVRYVLAYVGLTSLGAAVGVLVNSVVPPLPLTTTGVALRRLQGALADQLDTLVEGLGHAAPPDEAGWRRRRRRPDPPVAQMREVVRLTADARRWNWRARRWRDTADRQHDHARALERLSFVVEDLAGLVVTRETAEVADTALGPDLRPVTARALEALVTLLRSTPGAPHWPEDCQVLMDRTDELRGATRSEWRGTDRDRFTASALVVDLERALHSLLSAPEGRLHEPEGSSQAPGSSSTSRQECSGS